MIISQTEKSNFNDGELEGQECVLVSEARTK